MSVLHRQLLRCARMMVRFNKRVLSQLHALLKNKKAGRLALPSFAPSDSVPDGFLRAFWLALWLWVYRIQSTESTASSTEETYATYAPAFASVVSVYAAGYVTAVYTDSTEST